MHVHQNVVQEEEQLQAQGLVVVVEEVAQKHVQDLLEHLYMEEDLVQVAVMNILMVDMNKVVVPVELLDPTIGVLVDIVEVHGLHTEVYHVHHVEEMEE